MNFQELIQEVVAQESEVRELGVPIEDLRFESANMIIARGTQLQLTADGLSRIYKNFGAPPAYLNRLDERLRASLLQYHLEHGGLGDFVTILSYHDQFLSFGQPSLLRLSGEEVMSAVADGIGHEAALVSVQNFRHTPESFQVDILGDGVRAEVAPDDILQAGLRVTHSVIGEHATWIESFVLRLICSNGLTHRDCVSRRAARTRRLPVQHPGARELQRAQVRRLAANAWAALGEKLHALGELQGERIEFEQLYLRWLGQARLSARTLMPLLRQAWQAEGGQPTAYAALNALTRVATHHPGLTLRQRRTLAALAGVLAFRRLHLCPAAFQCSAAR
jgi:hypothetical protein